MILDESLSADKSSIRPVDTKGSSDELLAATSEGNHPSAQKRTLGSNKTKRGRPRTYPPESKLTRDSLRNVKQRCCNPNCRDYPRYAGRLYEGWLDPRKFYEDVVAEIGERPSRDRTLDRIDGGMYRPGNIRWASKREQAHNRGGTRLVEVDGEMVSMAEAARRLGVHRSTISRRQRESPERLIERRRRENLAKYSVLMRRLGDLERMWKRTSREESPDLARELQYLRGQEIVWMSGDRSFREPTEAEIDFADLAPTYSEYMEESIDEGRFLGSWVRGDRLELPAVKQVLDRHPAVKRQYEDALAEHRADEDRKRVEKAEEARAKKEREEKYRVHLLTIEMTPEAMAWRRENGVSDDEARRVEIELCREAEASFRWIRNQEMRDDFDRIERTLSKRLRIKLTLREMLLPFLDRIPAEVVSALNEMWGDPSEGDQRQARRKTNDEELASLDHGDMTETTEGGDPRYPGFQCCEHYEEHRDAAIGLGEWPEEYEIEDGDEVDEWVEYDDS